VAGFVDLPAQGLPLFGGQPALARAFSLTAGPAIGVLALLSARVGLGLVLLGRVVARVGIGVALLRLPVRGAS
jgi:hypothetical protein